MSDYGFGYDENDSQGQGQRPAQELQSEERAPKWYRDHMEKTSREMTELRQQLAKRDVAEALKAGGYDPGAASLFQGDPAKVNDWLTANGSFLAKVGSAEPVVEQGQQPAGPPATVVTPESQAALARMQSAGVEGAAAPLGSDQEMAAKVAACNNDDELNALLKANGNKFV